MDFEASKNDIQRRMDGAVEVLNKEFSGLRTGRASVGLLEPIMVDAYGQQMPINQVGTINLAEPRLLTVQVWDKSLAGSVEKSIRDSNLGLNPVTDNTLVRVPIPPLTEERRVEITKVAGKYAEDCRIALRNVRRNAMDELKKLEKNSDISKDERHEYEDEVQALTDSFVAKVDKALENKEQEILQV